MLFTNKEEIVYGILLVLIYTVILDKVLLMGSTRTKVEIMTEKYEELNRLIQERLDRGTTLVYTQTGPAGTGDRPTCIYDHWKCK